jgi:dihydrofolate synthase / folylpolyglutamate synthase
MPRRSSHGGSDRASPEYRATLAALFQRRRFGLRPGLDVIRALLGALGHPERSFPSIHVTGSKGKGSVATMAQALLTAHGVRTGLFTSPHLVDYRERVRVDGRPISPDAVVEGLARVEARATELEARGEIDRAPTFFEVTTALALDHFARAAVRAAVIEVGIGGRLDATNVLASRVGAITTIELEHTDILGGTLTDIAREKAGILHAGMTAVVGELPPEAARTVAAEAARVGVPLWHLGGELRVVDRTLSEDGQTFALRLPGRTVDGISVPLHGRFQPGNAALALGAVARFAEVTGLALDDRRIRAAFAGLDWHGRLERAGRRPELYYDVGHTPESARQVASSLGEMFPLADAGENAVVFGCLQGKDVPRMLDALAPLARTLVVVPVRSDRAVPTSDLRAQAIGRFARVVVARSAGEGLRLGRAATGADGFTLVFGSDYLIGELLRSSRRGEESPDLSDPGAAPPSDAEPSPPRAPARTR